MNTTDIGLLIAIISLVLLVVNMVLLIVFLKKNRKNKIPQCVQTETIDEAGLPSTQEGELIAVLTAAVAAMLQTSESQIRIQSYKRMSPSAWKKSARDSQIFNNL